MRAQPRLVVVDHTPLGEGTATGELKASLLEDWPLESILLAHTGPAARTVVVRGPGEQASPHAAPSTALEEILDFAPEVGLFRVSADNPELWDIAEALVFDQGVPTIIWIMDDWLQRLAVGDPHGYPAWEQRLRRLLEAAPLRLAISDVMARAMRDRFGLDFEVLANGVLPAHWPDRSHVRARPERQGRMLLRYAGGLADDMALDAVLMLSRAVAAVSQHRDIQLEVNTQAHWVARHGARFAGLRNVSVAWRDFDAAGYRQWVSEADVNVLAYNFDEASALYIGASLANKLPECLASGAALLAIGPSRLNTLAYCDRLPFVYRLDAPDPARLRLLLRSLHDQGEERARRGELGRLHAFETFDLAVARARLEGWLRAAARPSSVAPVRRAAPPIAEEYLRISVVVPNFNGGPLLRQTLRSIVHQEYPNLELIFVDGASTDESVAIAAEFRDQIAVFISEPDDGQGDALRKGFAQATGEIMGWMNSDDILMPGALFTLNRVFRQHSGVEWVTGRKTMLLEDGTVYLVDEARPWSRARFMAGDYRFIQQESTFWRRSLWERAGAHIDDSLRLAVDLELWIRFFECARLYSLDTTIGGFRLRSGQRSAAQRDAYENEALMLLRRAHDRLEPCFTERRGDILPIRFEPRSRESTERAFPDIVSDDPPVIRFTGRSRDFEILGRSSEHPRGEPIDGGAWFDGLHGFEFRGPTVPDVRSLVGLRLRFSPAGRAPISLVDQFTESDPATVVVVGPLMVVQSGPLKVEVVVRTAEGTRSISLPFDRDTVSLDLEVRLDEMAITVHCNGDLVADQPQPDAPGLLFDGLRLGVGLKQRFWFGAVDRCELSVRESRGAGAWDAFAPEHWSGHRRVSRDFEMIDASPPTGPAGPRPDRLTALRGRHAGERCFVMGSGPSLNKMDLSLLEGETVISCNASFLLFDRVRWRPRYYTCVDARVLSDRGQEIGDMLRGESDITGLFPHVVHLHDGSGAVLDTRKLVGVRPNTLFFREVFNSDRDLPYSMFSTDINDHVVQPYTVTITMLQIAAYLGFSEIHLIGCDTSYTVSDSVIQEGQTAEAGIGLLLTSTQDDDPNHFDPRYFGRGRKWHNPQVASMIMHYGYAKQVLDEIGVRVFNATVGGNLEVFPRVAFEHLFDTPAGATSRLASPTGSGPRTPALNFPSAPATAELDSRLLILAGDSAESPPGHAGPVMALHEANGPARAQGATYAVALDAPDHGLVARLSRALASGSTRRILASEAIAEAMPASGEILSVEAIEPLFGPAPPGARSPLAIALLWAEVLGFSRIAVAGDVQVSDDDAVGQIVARLRQTGADIQLLPGPRE